MKILTIILALLSIPTQSSLAFAPSAKYNVRPFPNIPHQMTATLQEPSSMRVGELKKELESYGLSTKSYFEKSDLVTAVEKARLEGKTPSQKNASADSSSTSTSQSPSSTSSKSRDERLAEEIEKCKDMKASELRAELKSYGISAASFFEKSEFVQAVAEARVDGTAKKRKNSEGYAEYAEVEVITDESTGPRKRSEQGASSQKNPFGNSAQKSNPFGGMGGGFGGMGANPFAGMGGNPFGGSGAGTNPFAGMGGNPFGAGAGGMGGMGDQMKKVQEMMSNPNIQKIMAKAQSNPKIMKAVSECMQNPMAFAKYQNDPEVGELIRELQKYM